VTAANVAYHPGSSWACPVLCLSGAQDDVALAQRVFERRIVFAAQHPASVERLTGAPDTAGRVLRAVGSGQGVVVDECDLDARGAGGVGFGGEVLVDATLSQRVGGNQQDHSGIFLVSCAGRHTVSCD
jgi:hypothetical protein